jgi:hypothetical protein
MIGMDMNENQNRFLVIGTRSNNSKIPYIVWAENSNDAVIKMIEFYSKQSYKGLERLCFINVEAFEIYNEIMEIGKDD